LKNIVGDFSTEACSGKVGDLPDSQAVV